MRKTVVGLSRSTRLAAEISRILNARYLQLEVKSFPDGETYLRYPAGKLSGHVILVQTMHPAPNDAIIEALFAGRTARELGAKKVTLLSPYMAYLRQDKRFRSGECVSNHILAGLLDFFDEIITVDPHLHRIRSLKTIFKTNARHVTADGIIAEFVRKKYPDAMFIGPDIESSQWAQIVAEKTGNPFVILKKKRYSAASVRIKVHTPETVRGKTVVLVDDIISTGHTMLEPLKQLKRLGAGKMICICVHGVFADGALALLKRAGAEVVATDTISNPVAGISVAGLLAGELK